MDLKVLDQTFLFVWKSLRSFDKLLKAMFNAVKNDADDAWNKSVSRFMEHIGART